MKNGNEPANPINTFAKEGDLAVSTNKHQGLTKREMFAMHAMSAYLIAQTDEGTSIPGFKEAAEEAVSYADALLEELDK